MNDSPLLTVQNLSFRYPQYAGLACEPLFRDASLELEEGKIGLLLAKPDQGKTTFCRILTGLVPRFSGGELEGRINLFGTDLRSYLPYELLEQVGLVFQNPGEQLFLSRCDTEIAFALESLGLARERIEERLQSALSRLGLTSYRNRNPQTLSGGEKKKLLVACLLAVQPRLWLLDETLEELDGKTKALLLELLKMQQRTALIFSAKWHDLFLDYVNRVFLLHPSGMREIREKPGSRGFFDLLAEQGFILSQPILSQRAGQRSGPELRPERRQMSGPGGPGQAEPLLQAEDLSYTYDPEQPGERPFTLEIEQLCLRAGETLALVGDNGSGKSTLARLLCGLLVPQRGTISIRRAAALETASVEELHSFTAYLFQDPDLQIFLPSVFEELALGLKRLGLPAGEIETRVERVISLFHLPAGQTPPALMSYGARKRLQAGVYHLLERPLVIIDEGDSGLGVNDFAEMLQLFRSPERALLFITHDHRLAGALADGVLTLQGGKLA